MVNDRLEFGRLFESRVVGYDSPKKELRCMIMIAILPNKESSGSEMFMSRSSVLVLAEFQAN